MKICGLPKAEVVKISASPKKKKLAIINFVNTSQP
jgi:hypothetical protein